MIRTRSFKIWILGNNTLYLNFGWIRQLLHSTTETKVGSGYWSKQRWERKPNRKMTETSNGRTKDPAEPGEHGGPKSTLYENLINEYNPSVYNISVAIVGCSYMFRLLQGNHHQAVNQKYKKISSSNLLTYLLTPCSRILLEKLTGFQLVKKFPEFYGTRRFITAFTNIRHRPVPTRKIISFLNFWCTAWRLLLWSQNM
jgi:hypothetical protein